MDASLFNEKGEQKMKNYLFVCKEGPNEGEEFFVQEENYAKAKEIAEKYFGVVRFCGVFTDEEAEMWGLDTY